MSKPGAEIAGLPFPSINSDNTRAPQSVSTGRGHEDGSNNAWRISQYIGVVTLNKSEPFPR